MEITGFLGSSWLRRRTFPEVKREVELPRPAEIVLLEPSMETTDRANHMLRGKTESSIRVVSVTIGEEARTVTVRDGAFEAPISLRAGENPIVVTGLDPFGRAVRAARAIRYIPPRPTIEIFSPAAGAVADITRSPVVIVRGSIRSETPLREAFLIQNDIPRNIRVREDGSFEQSAILITEEDTFQVEALDTAGRAGISAIRSAPAHGVPDRPLMAILHWDEDDVDLDLHVTDGSGYHTWFDAADPLDAPGAIPEGKLWIDNRKGYGPEVFSIERDAPGEYTFSAEYYRGKKPCRAFLTLVLFAGTPSRKLVRNLRTGDALPPGDRRADRPGHPPVRNRTGADRSHPRKGTAMKIPCRLATLLLILLFPGLVVFPRAARAAEDATDAIEKELAPSSGRWIPSRRNSRGSRRSPSSRRRPRCGSRS